MKKRSQYLYGLGLVILLSFAGLSGCGDQVQDVTVSVKTSDKAGAALRYVQFTLNERGMITNKNGLKETKLKLKKGDPISFNLVRLPNGYVLTNPGQRASWNSNFNGDSSSPVVFNVVLKPEGEAVAEVPTLADAGVAVAALGGSEEVEADVVAVADPRRVEPSRQVAPVRREAVAPTPRTERLEPVERKPRRRNSEPARTQDDVLELPPLPSREEPRRDPEPMLPDPEPVMPDPEPIMPDPERRDVVEEDPLLGLEGIGDEGSVGSNEREMEPSAAELEPLPQPYAEPELAAIAPTEVDDDLDGLLMLDDTAGGGVVIDASTLKRLRTKLDNGVALSAGEIGDLESTPKKPKREFVESRRLLADWYYQNRQWRKQAGALKIATETRGPYRRDPMVLLSLGKAYGHLKSYRQASKVMSKVERYGNRLPKERRADAYRFHAEMLEFQFLKQQRDDPEKANAELIDQAMSKLRKLITFVGSASPEAKRFAKERLVKLEELKRRVAE